MEITLNNAPIVPTSTAYFAAYEDEVIILDLVSDQYIVPTPAVSRAILWALASNEQVKPDNADALLAPLFERKLLTTSDEPSARSFTEPKEPCGLADLSWRPHKSVLLPSKTHVLHITRALYWLGRAYQWVRYGTDAVLSHLQRHLNKASGRINDATPTSEIAKLVEAHIRARMIYPRRIACLVGSAALAAHGWAEHMDFQFVIGVQKYPFNAHAWVQTRGIVVNDAPEPALRLAPILTLPLNGSDLKHP